MSRSEYLRHNPRRVLAALATLLLAAAVAVGSGANFTASSANPSNTFSTGTLDITNTQSGAIVSMSNMRPGDSQTGTVDITNSGSLSGTFTLAESNVTGAALAGQLDLSITDCGDVASADCATGTSLYSGKLDSLTSTALGTFAAGQGRRYEFTVTLPSSTGNAFQGTSASAQFDWSAAS
jgi:spore coat-associated protein N